MCDARISSEPWRWSPSLASLIQTEQVRRWQKKCNTRCYQRSSTLNLDACHIFSSCFSYSMKSIQCHCVGADMQEDEEREKNPSISCLNSPRLHYQSQWFSAVSAISTLFFSFSYYFIIDVACAGCMCTGCCMRQSHCTPIDRNPTNEKHNRSCTKISIFFCSCVSSMMMMFDLEIFSFFVWKYHGIQNSRQRRIKIKNHKKSCRYRSHSFCFCLNTMFFMCVSNSESYVCIWFISIDEPVFRRPTHKIKILSSFSNKITFYEWIAERNEKHIALMRQASRCWLVRTLCSCALKLNHFSLFCAFHFSEKNLSFFCAVDTPHWLNGMCSRRLVCAKRMPFSVVSMCIGYRFHRDCPRSIYAWIDDNDDGAHDDDKHFPKKKKKKNLCSDRWCVFLLFIFLNFCQPNVSHTRIRILCLPDLSLFLTYSPSISPFLLLRFHSSENYGVTAWHN